MEKKKTTSETAVATASAEKKEVLKAMIREACRNERLNKETEDRLADGLYRLVQEAATAYAACRAYAWNGLAMSYTVETRVDSESISTTDYKHNNDSRMDLPPSLFLSRLTQKIRKRCLFGIFSKITFHTKVFEY